MRLGQARSKRRLVGYLPNPQSKQHQRVTGNRSVHFPSDNGFHLDGFDSGDQKKESLDCGSPFPTLALALLPFVAIAQSKPFLVDQGSETSDHPRWRAQSWWKSGPVERQCREKLANDSRMLLNDYGDASLCTVRGGEKEGVSMTTSCTTQRVSTWSP